MDDFAVKFAAKLWLYDGRGGWHFLTLPAAAAQQIRLFSDKPSGFGAIRVAATVGETTWKTSLFPDNASNSFLLPVKAEVRKKERLLAGDKVVARLFLA